MSKSKIQAERMDYAAHQVLEAGYDITFQCESRFDFIFMGNRIMVYPYKGWFTGVGIRDGRGIENLIRQI